ncbi:hypothetical protein [Rubellicoccus peritrichatus]|uniref:Glycosyl transferase family 10 (Putative fucosyltransferase) n=1 Tax=Rubellicoccus peritrichatus TaxID=3080537 RepID=A0AAQ3L600_9BACT|nr:hypothetical protein [Puniceicoccus sp. CR14]WOO39686.1 hypothetical protein RZN69_13770 [Puniceicoccus sp. CR14]
MSFLPIPDKPLDIALYDKELGEVDFRQINKHTGEVVAPNPWLRFVREAEDLHIAMYTDRSLEQVLSTSHQVKVAWLLESPQLMSKPYRALKKLEKHFDRIFTFSESLLKRGRPYQMCVGGGSWIADHDWSMHPKSRNISIIASTKKYLPGHKLRFAMVDRFRDSIDGLFGQAFEPVDRKIDGMRDFRFSIAIENCKEDFYFSEKLIDCFATATIPIYWGCPSIARFFDPQGIIAFNKPADLDKIIPQLGAEYYERCLPAIRRNFTRAKAFQMVESNLYAGLHGWSMQGPLIEALK